MRLVECVSNEFWLAGFGPKKGEVCRVASEGFRVPEYPNVLYIELEEYPGASYRIIFFREIEFPPSLEKEIAESLTRELQPC